LQKRYLRLYHSLQPHASAQEVVGRRLRVYWPDEGDWFFGEVTGYDGKTGRHNVSYDDGDVENLSLSASAGERFEWVSDQAGAADGSGLRLVRQAEAQDQSWPRVSDLLWGRVKVWSRRRLRQARSRLTAGSRLVAWSGRRAAGAPASVRRCLRSLFR
jgi:hypothetical protein